MFGRSSLKKMKHVHIYAYVNNIFFLTYLLEHGIKMKLYGLRDDYLLK